MFIEGVGQEETIHSGLDSVGSAGDIARQYPETAGESLDDCQREGFILRRHDKEICCRMQETHILDGPNIADTPLELERQAVGERFRGDAAR